MLRNFLVCLSIFLTQVGLTQDICVDLTCNTNVLSQDSNIAATISETANSTVYQIEYIIFKRTNPEPSDENLIINPLQWIDQVYFAIDYEEHPPLDLATNTVALHNQTQDLLDFTPFKSNTLIAHIVNQLSKQRTNIVQATANTEKIPRQISLMHNDYSIKSQSPQPAQWVKLEYLGLGLIPKILNQPTRKISISFVSNPIWSGYIPTEIISANLFIQEQEIATDSYTQRINPFDYEDSLLQLANNTNPISAQASINQSYTQSNTNFDVSNIQSLLFNQNQTDLAADSNVTSIIHFFHQMQNSDEFIDMYNRLSLSPEYEVLDVSSWLQPALPKKYSVGTAFKYETVTDNHLSGTIALLKDRFLHIQIDFSEFERLAEIDQDHLNHASLNLSINNSELSIATSVIAPANLTLANASNFQTANLANELIHPVLAAKPTLFDRVNHWGKYLTQIQLNQVLQTEINQNNSLPQSLNPNQELQLLTDGAGITQSDTSIDPFINATAIASNQSTNQTNISLSSTDPNTDAGAFHDAQITLTDQRQNNVSLWDTFAQYKSVRSETNSDQLYPSLNFAVSAESMSKYYFDHAATIYNPISPMAVLYSYQSSRKIELDEIHYFDHPNMGVLIRVVEIEPENLTANN